jgi:hypothetical protein
MDKLLRILGSPLFLFIAGGAWFVTLFLPVFPIYKGGSEPEMHWALGWAYFGVLTQPDWIEGWAFMAGHLLLCALVGLLCLYGMLFVADVVERGKP